MDRISSFLSSFCRDGGETSVESQRAVARPTATGVLDMYPCTAGRDTPTPLLEGDEGARLGLKRARQRRRNDATINRTCRSRPLNAGSRWGRDWVRGRPPRAAPRAAAPRKGPRGVLSSRGQCSFFVRPSPPRRRHHHRIVASTPLSAESLPSNFCFCFRVGA